jgi:hypothetical protein
LTSTIAIECGDKMPPSLREITWPDFFVVEYRDGQSERLRREWNGVSFLPPRPGDGELDDFVAWPVEQPAGRFTKQGVKYGRI